MKTKLKQFRVNAGMTQAKIAAAVGVTQPNYHRWETGAAPIPEAKLKKLAKVLKANPKAILGRHPPIEASLYDDSVSDDLSYYGEVAIHFCGGGDSLLLSISEDAFTRLHRDLQTDAVFVSVESLANQTVIIRTKAIADVYFSSEAYDDFGPENDTYDSDNVELQIPDARDWEIVECLACDEIGIGDFDPADVERVRKMIMITDKQYETLVSEGHIKVEDLEKERTKNRAETDRIFGMALMTTYQLSTGKRRRVPVNDSEDLFDALYELVDFGDSTAADGLVRLETEGRHRIAFISKQALDYISIPTHKFKEGTIEAGAATLDS